jgi:hypothetical protein
MASDTYVDHEAQAQSGFTQAQPAPLTRARRIAALTGASILALVASPQLQVLAQSSPVYGHAACLLAALAGGLLLPCAWSAKDVHLFSGMQAGGRAGLSVLLFACACGLLFAAVDCLMDLSLNHWRQGYWLVALAVLTGAFVHAAIQILVRKRRPQSAGAAHPMD